MLNQKYLAGITTVHPPPPPQQQHPPANHPSLPNKPSPNEENRHYLKVFIQTYRSLSVLWDTTLRDYTNRDKRAEAYQQLLPIYRYLKRDANLDDVKKKINTLRTNYRKELKVVETARREGNIHQPRCWTFYELDFLRNAEKFLATPIKSEHCSYDVPENPHSGTNHFMDPSGTPFPFHVDGVLSPTPSISEMFQKSFGQTPGSVIPPKPQAAPNHNPQPYHHGHHLAPSSGGGGGGGGGGAKRPRTSITSFPEEESVARTWTHKLKRLSREQRLFAEKFINEILFEAETGTLHRNSMQLNSPFEPCVRFDETQNGDEKSQSPQVNRAANTPTSSQNSTTTVSNNQTRDIEESSSRSENENNRYNSYTA